MGSADVLDLVKSAGLYIGGFVAALVAGLVTGARANNRSARRGDSASDADNHDRCDCAALRRELEQHRQNLRTDVATLQRCIDAAQSEAAAAKLAAAVAMDRTGGDRS